MPLFNSNNPPPFWEIIGLPLSGAMAIDAFHTKQNELVLFFIPFHRAVPIACNRSSPVGTQNAPSRKNMRGVEPDRRVFLILFECGVVVATNPTVPLSVGVIVMIPFAVYVILRLGSRRYWMLAGAISGEV